MQHVSPGCHNQTPEPCKYKGGYPQLLLAGTVPSPSSTRVLIVAHIANGGGSVFLKTPCWGSFKGELKEQLRFGRSPH